MTSTTGEPVPAAGPKPRGRFVAGATCPRCAAIDRVQVDIETGLRRWCVVCDFDETLAPVGTPSSGPGDVPALPVRIFAAHVDGATRETK